MSAIKSALVFLVLTFLSYQLWGVRAALAVGIAYAAIELLVVLAALGIAGGAIKLVKDHPELIKSK